MILRQGMANKWAIENGKGMILCERTWNSQREAEEWAKAYLSSWVPAINYTLVLIEKDKKKESKPLIKIKEDIKITKKEISLPPIPIPVTAVQSE